MTPERKRLKEALRTANGALLVAAANLGVTRAWMEYHVEAEGLARYAAKLRFRAGVSGGRSAYSPTRGEDERWRRKVALALLTGGTQSEAAARLGIHRRRLQREIARLGIG